MSSQISNERPRFDEILTKIADYVLQYQVDSEEALQTARYCLMDTLGCGMEALAYPACTKLLGPIVPGIQVQNGARVPGTYYVLDPVQAALIWGQWCGGWISTIPGWLLSGGILRIIWVVS